MSVQNEQSLLRSSTVMALGTIASRVTGFLRTAVLAFALGTAALADAYNTANVVPNIVYELLLGGILTSVVVPLIVRAKRRDADRGEAYEQRLFTLVTIVLFVCTVAAVIAAGPIISLYAGRFTEPQRDLAVTLARFFLPQIFFYGVGAMAQAILNTRGRFAAPMWTPVLNNLVVMGVGATFLAISTTDVSPATITADEVQLLGIGTTAGIVAQTVALIPPLYRAGFRWRVRADFARVGLREIGGLAGWIVGYVVTNQLALLVTTNLANSAGVTAREEGVAYGAGYTPYVYAYMLFLLPHAIVGVSIITALLPRMSEHATERRFDLVRDDFSSGLRLSYVVIVPAAVVMIALGPQITVLLFGHLRTSVTDAVYIGYVLSAFGIGLIAFNAAQLVLRVFYAMHDTRTPAVINVGRGATNAILNVAAFFFLPAGWIVVGLALGFAISYFFAITVSWLVLRRRVGGLDGKRVARTLTRLTVAAVPGGVVAYAIASVATRSLGEGSIASLVSLILGLVGVAGTYLVMAKKLRVAEVATVLDLVRSRIPRGSATHGPSAS